MIDNPYQVDALLCLMQQVPPLPVRPSGDLAALLRRQRPDLDVPQGLRVTSVSYAGDAGGIMCRVETAGGADAPAVHVSLTHLRLDPRHPLAHEVASYQHRRAKRLRRGMPAFASAPGAMR